MHKKTIIIMIYLLMLSSLSANALQVISIKDNQTALIKVSSNQQSRLFVKGERISVVRGLEGAYDLKKDDKLGDVYIQPTPYFQQKAFNLFVTTEEGRTFSLLASPLDTPAETNELKPVSPLLALAQRWELNTPYSQALMNLISAMVNTDSPEGYAVVNIDKVKPIRLANELTMQLLTVYKGSHLQGEVWEIKNKSKNTAYIHPRDLYQQHVLAASLRDEVLRAQKETLLYRVVNDDK
jgi:conjugal transfer pilus assembly protein TraK